MQIHDVITDEMLNKAITAGSIITTVTIFWKKILAFFKFFYRAYIAVDKIYAIEKQVHGNGGGSLPDKIDKLINLVTDLKNDIYRLHQIQIILSNAVDYGFFYCDLEGNNTEVNRIYSKALGLQNEDLLGKNYLNYIDNHEEYEKIWEKAFSKRRNLEAKVNFVKDGVLIPSTIKTTLLYDTSGPCGYIGFIYFNQG